MPTTIVFRRGTSAPTSASGLTLGEPAFNTTQKTLFVGLGTGVTAAWVGAVISGLSTDIGAGITYQIPTMSAVKDYVASTTSGVATLNSLTGAITLNAGTAIGVTTASGNITVTNQGVQSFNGLTGAVGGVTTSVANTFTAAQTFNAGITASTLDVTGQAKFNGNVNFGDAAADVMTVNGGMTVGSSLDVTGVARFNGNVTVGDAASDVFTVTAGSTFGITDHSGAARFASTATVSGVLTATGGATFGVTDHSGAARFASTAAITGVLTANGGITASTLDVTGTSRFTGAVTTTSDLTVGGNLTVNGTTTTINSTIVAVDDINIILGDTVSPTDTTASGGGITLKGTSDKLFYWSNSTAGGTLASAWNSNQNINITSGSYAIGATTVLSSNTLGSGVVNSSLTSVGTIGTGVWQGTAVGATYGGTGRSSYTIGDILYANGTSSLTVLNGVTAGRLLAANGAGTAPEYKQLIVNDGSGTSIATITSGAGTLTAAIQNSTTAVRGVASFDPEMFTVTSGNASISRVDGGTY